MRRLEEWIDYLEGEVDRDKLAKLGLLAEFSREDRLVLENLRRLRAVLEMTDPADEIRPALRDENLKGSIHKNVMKRILDSKSRVGKKVSGKRQNLNPNY